MKKLFFAVLATFCLMQITGYATWQVQYPNKIDCMLPVGDGSLLIGAGPRGLLQIDENFKLIRKFPLSEDFSSWNYCQWNLIRNFDGRIRGHYCDHIFDFNIEEGFTNILPEDIGRMDILPGQNGALWLVVDLCDEGPGSIWFCDQCFFYVDDTACRYTSICIGGRDYTGRDDTKYGVLALSDRMFWMLQDGGKCVQYNGDRFIEYYLTTQGRMMIAGRDNDHLFVADHGGRLYQFIDYQWVQVSKTDDVDIFLGTDFENRPWLITQDGRVQYWDGEGFILSATLPGADTLVFESSGVIWASGSLEDDCMLLWRFDGHQWTGIKQRGISSDLRDATVYEDRILAVGNKGSVFAGRGQAWLPIVEDASLGDLDLIEVGPDGVIWISGDKGLYEVSEDGVEKILDGGWVSICPYGSDALILADRSTIYKYEHEQLLEIYTQQEPDYIMDAQTRDGVHIHAIESCILPVFGSYLYFNLDSGMEPEYQVDCSDGIMNLGDDNILYLIERGLSQFDWDLFYMDAGQKVKIASESGQINQFLQHDGTFWMVGIPPKGTDINKWDQGIFRYRDGQFTEMFDSDPLRVTSLIMKDQTMYAFGDQGAVWVDDYPELRLSVTQTSDGPDFSGEFDLRLKTGDNSGSFDFYIIAESSLGYYSLDPGGEWADGIMPMAGNLSAGAQGSCTLELPLPFVIAGSEVTFYCVMVQDDKLLDFSRTDLTIQ